MEEKDETPEERLKRHGRRVLDNSLRYLSKSVLRDRIRNAREDLRRTNETLARHAERGSASLISRLMKRRRLTTRSIRALTEALARKIELEARDDNTDAAGKEKDGRS
jgi:hypothetical protein